MSHDADSDNEEDAWYSDAVNAEDGRWRCIRCATLNDPDDDICKGCGAPKAISMLS